jgi:hypothetical protein
MHLAMPGQGEEDPNDCHGHRLRTRILNAMSPSSSNHCHSRKFVFSLFYTVAHVFTFMNTILYWAILVPAGHGGFRPPKLPHHHHPPSNTTVMYDPGMSVLCLSCHLRRRSLTAMAGNGTDKVTEKGLFDEDDIKAFSIINIWSITSILAFIEIMFLNSIRRQTVSSTLDLRCPESSMLTSILTSPLQGTSWVSYSPAVGIWFGRTSASSLRATLVSFSSTQSSLEMSRRQLLQLALLSSRSRQAVSCSPAPGRYDSRVLLIQFGGNSLFLHVRPHRNARAHDCAPR